MTLASFGGRRRFRSWRSADDFGGGGEEAETEGREGNKEREAVMRRPNARPGTGAKVGQAERSGGCAVT